MCRWERGPYLGLGYMPALLGALMLLGIVTTYLVATFNNHVEAFFPYISDTGVDLPESCIFSQFFNMAAMLGAVVMYLRYKLIQGLVEDKEPRITKLSKINLGIACFSCFGLSIVANFQEMPPVKRMFRPLAPPTPTPPPSMEPYHLTGAVMVFGLGVVYAFIDTYITYRMHPTYNGRIIFVARFLVGLLGLISLIISIVAGTISRFQWATKSRTHSRIHWQPDDPGFIAHLCSTFGEWAMAASFLFYYITFIRDFQRFNIEVTTILYVGHLDEAPRYHNEDEIDPNGALAPPDIDPDEPNELSPLLV